MIDKRRPAVRGLDDLWVHGDSAQKGDTHFIRHRLSSTRLEYVNHLMAVGTDKTAHILHNSQDRNADLLAEIDALLDVVERQVLRGGHNNGAVRAGNKLGYRKGLIPRPGGEIYDQVIQFSPSSPQ